MSATNETILSIRNVSKRFPGVLALDGVSLDIAAGELHSVCGENGAGKSTLMKILSGVIPDYDGEILLRGKPVRFEGVRDAQAAGVGIIHQELNLAENLSAAANIFLGRERTRLFGLLDDRGMRKSAGELLAELECHVDPATPVGELRVGDQQLVEIAKALSQQTDVLIMDEPTSALTESETARLFRVVDRLRAKGVTIFYISHKMEEIFRLSDRITVLRDGKHVRTLNRSETDAKQITHLMVGRELEEVDLSQGRKSGDVILEVEHLSLPWHGHARGWRLHDVSFQLRVGEIVGIAGLMGAGRTELLECLFGAAPERPQGTIKLAGKAVAFTHPAQATEAGVALVTEDRKRLGIIPQMTVRENITLCTLGECATGGLIGTRREREAAEETVRDLGVKTAGVESPITGLSGGNQQKAIVGRWLRTKPKVLLLDDPTRGVDVGAKAELYRLMDRLCRDGLGILVTSSELPELLIVCDRILVLCEGRLTGEFTRAEATEHKIMEAAVARTPAAAVH